MAENRIIQLILKAKDEATAVLSKAESGVESFGRKAGTMFKAVAALAVAGVLGKFFKDSIGEGAKAEAGIVRLGVAVTNAGGDFQRLRPSLEEAIDGVRRLTTYTDDDLRAALTNMITVTGDVEGSTKNLGLAADLAAFKNIDLADAGTLVAKAMNGNVTALNKMGIAGKDSTTVLANLAASMGGFAEGQAKTFSGRLTQLNNQWGEFKEAVGTAILSSGELGGGVSKLTGLLRDLELWIVRNQESIAGFVGAIVDLASWVGGQLATLFRDMQIFAVDLALAWDTARANLRGVLGNILLTFSEFLGQNRILLTLMGDGLTEIADKMGDAGVKMVRSSIQQLGQLNGVRKEMYAEIEEGEKGLTKAEWEEQKRRARQAGEAEKARIRLTKESAEAREKREKELGKELEKINTDIAVKTLMIEQGLTKDQATEQVRRLAVIEGGTKRIVTTVEDGYKKLDTLNLMLAAGFDKEVTPSISRTETAIADLSDEMRTAPTTTFEQQVEDLAEKLGISADAARRMVTELKNKGASREIEAAARGALGLSQTLGLVDDKMAAAAQNAITMAENFGKALGGNPTAIIGAVGGLAGVLSGLFGESPETRARKELLRANTSALRESAAKLGDLLNLNTAGEKFAGVEDALTAFLSGKGDKLTKGGKVNAFELGKQLVKAGVNRADLSAVAADLGIELTNKETGKLEIGALQQLLEAIGTTEFGQFGSDLGSQLDRIRRGIGIGAIAKEDELSQILGVLSSEDASSPALLKALQGLDLGSAEGRATGVESLRGLFGQLNTGQLGAKDFGDLSGRQFLDVLEQLITLLSSDRAFNVSPLGAAASLVGDPFGIGAGSPDFTEALSMPLGQSVDLLGSIDENILRIADALTAPTISGATVGTSMVVNVTVATAPGATAQENAVALADAIDIELAKRYQANQIAVGSAVRA